MEPGEPVDATTREEVESMDATAREEVADAEQVEPDDPAAADLDGVRPPRQERSRRTLDRIAEAALDLLAERGRAGTTVQEIVDRAGSSVGSFYARFDGKDGLLRYLEERVRREAGERWDRALAEVAPVEGGLDETVGAVVRLLVDVHAIRAGGGPAPMASSPGGDGPFGVGPDFQVRVRSDLARLLLAHRDRIDHPEPEAAVDFLVRVLEAAIPALVGSGAAEELHRLALGYLARRRRTGDRADRVDFFDVWG